MKLLIRLCRSVARGNRGATAGIFIMAVLSAAIAFLGANFGVSGSDTVLGFISSSGTPDAVYVTGTLPDETRGRIGRIPGVKLVSPGFIYDTAIETADGLYSARAFRLEADSPYTNTPHESISAEGADPYVCLSSKFAEYNDIHAGDSIILFTPSGKETVTVRATVSGPETMNCVRDDFSAYESYRFAYLYFDPEDFNALVPAEGFSNRWLVYFEAPLTESEEKDCTRMIREVFSDQLISETLTDESQALKSVRGDLDTVSVLCRFIPGIIWLICLGFNFIFIRVIAENRRKTVGLLRALGFSARRCVLVFAVYAVLTALPGLLCGTLAGTALLRACLGLLAEAKGISAVTVTLLPLPTVLMLLAVPVSGVLSALMSAGAISKIDPAEACGGSREEAEEPPGLIRALKAGAFVKISLSAALRNRKRQAAAALCITACVICMCVGFEGVYSIGYPIDAVFGGRFLYDIQARGISPEEIETIINSVSCIETAEPSALFTADMNGQSVRAATAEEGQELTVLTDTEGRRLYPGDGVIIDEMFAKLNGLSAGDTVELDGLPLTVTGVAREILYTLQYVSSETAARLGHDAPNSVMLKLREGTPPGEAKKQISAVCPGAYLAEFSSQKENIRDGFMAMRAIMLVFAVLAFLTGSVLVINITVIDFNENRYRYAALRALGTPVNRLGGISAVQNLTRALLGVLIACPLCGVCVNTLLHLLSGAEQQYVPVRYTGCLLLSCLIPLLYVLIGAVISLRRIRKMDFCGIINEAE